MFATIKRHGWLVSTLRFVPVIGIAGAAVAFSASAALAINPHTVPSNPIVCQVVQTDAGPAVECAGAICGLGQGAVIIETDVALACETKPGSNQPGGHLQATTEPITPEHGCVEFDVTTAAAECPPGLVPVVGEVATISVFRAATGELLFEEDFTIP
jgi:hypothetical protein